MTVEAYGMNSDDVLGWTSALPSTGNMNGHFVLPETEPERNLSQLIQPFSPQTKVLSERTMAARQVMKFIGANGVSSLVNVYVSRISECNLQNLLVGDIVIKTDASGFVAQFPPSSIAA